MAAQIVLIKKLILLLTALVTLLQAQHAPLKLGGATPTNTYRLEWKERFHTKQIALDIIGKHPDLYPNYSEVANPEKEYEIMVWREYVSSTTNDALIQAGTVEPIRHYGASLEQKNIDGTLTTDYATGSLRDINSLIVQ